MLDERVRLIAAGQQVEKCGAFVQDGCHPPRVAVLHLSHRSRNLGARLFHHALFETGAANRGMSPSTMQ